MRAKAETRAGNLVLAVRRLRKLCGDRRLTFILRVILGSLFVLSAVGKLPNQLAFVNVVTSYNLLPADLARLYGYALPWLELAVGFLLIIGLFSRYAAAASILMVISFIIANGTGVFRMTGCGCFGELFEFAIRTSDALIIDIVIFIFALQIALNKEDFLSIGSLFHG